MADRDRALPVKSGPAGEIERNGWRGDEHKLQIKAATEAGLRGEDIELELYTEGFKRAVEMEDPADGAIVVRGRTVLNKTQLRKELQAMLRYVGVTQDAVHLRVHDGTFELRVAKRAAEASRPVLSAGKIALQVFIGFGLLGLAANQFFPGFVASIIWGLGLLLGGWQLRRGLASGRAMLSAHLAVGLAILAREGQLILPPAGEGPGGSPAGDSPAGDRPGGEGISALPGDGPAV